MERHATPECAVHLHVHKDNRIILEWHDTFDDPMHISKAIDEEKTKHFCEELSLKNTLLTKKSICLFPITPLWEKAGDYYIRCRKLALDVAKEVVLVAGRTG